MSNLKSNYPLSGITVIDLSHIYNGPYATFLMAMASADVIRREPLPERICVAARPRRSRAAVRAMFNSNKERPVTLNLKSEKGRQLPKEMVQRADILVENFAPGVMDCLGVGATALHESTRASSHGRARAWQGWSL
jgi:formyl-CoA transferase